MEVINTCIQFLVKFLYFWILFFVLHLVLIAQAVHAYFKLDRPEIKKEFTPLEIEMTRRRICGCLQRDMVITSILFLLVILSLGLKMCLHIFAN